MMTAQPPKPDTRTEPDTRTAVTAQVTTCESGLRIASDQMMQVPSVSVAVWIDVGARAEKPEECGIAHFFEHMVFKGTPRFDARAIAEEIESRGGFLNAFTSREHTAFYSRVLTQDLDFAVDLLAELVHNASFPQQELERERAVVLHEIGEAADIPEDIAYDALLATAYPDQAIGRPILGTSAVVGQLCPDDLRAFRHRHYRSPRMTVVAAGGCTHEQLVTTVTESFRATPGEEASGEEPARYQGGVTVIKRPLDQSRLFLALPAPGICAPERTTLSLASILLGGSSASRLFQEVREKRGLAYSIGCNTDRLRETSLLTIYAAADPRQIPALIEVIGQELHALCARVSAEELARAQRLATASLLMGQESSSARSDRLASDLLSFGRIRSIQEITAAIAAVTVDDITALCARMVAQPASLALIGPATKDHDWSSLVNAIQNTPGQNTPGQNTPGQNAPGQNTPGTATP